MTLLRAVLTVIFAGLFVVAASAQSAPGRRVALVIGNSAYAAQGTLANPGPDSRLVADALRRVGFTVTARNDLGKQAMELALRDFSRAADGAEVALIYYAGHGMEANGVNWLLPVDAVLAEERNLNVEAISLDTMIGSVSQARVLRMVVLDACRNNPFSPRMRRVGASNTVVRRGLAEVEVSGTLILYAARGGTVSHDGPPGGHSPFATAFSRRLAEPGVDVRLLVGSVRDDVLATTSRAPEPQEPFSYGSLPGVQISLALNAAHGDRTKSARAALSAIPIEEWVNLGDGFFMEMLRLAPLQEYIELADFGDAQAQFITGSAYFLGQGGVEKSGVLAARYWRMAAAQGLPAAQNNLATMIARGEGGLEMNERRAAELYRLAADQGHVSAQNTFGTLLAKGIGGVDRDDSEAVRYYRLSADSGNARAQTNLADMFLQGRGGLQRDETIAVGLLREAAEKGYPRAINNLGVLTEQGRGGLRRDRAAAKALYAQAAEKGYQEALQNLRRLSQR